MLGSYEYATKMCYMLTFAAIKMDLYVPTSHNAQTMPENRKAIGLHHLDPQLIYRAKWEHNISN